jgi:hypothetical protein
MFADLFIKIPTDKIKRMVKNAEAVGLKALFFQKGEERLFRPG